jgi:hypothetical protein
MAVLGVGIGERKIAHYARLQVPHAPHDRPRSGRNGVHDRLETPSAISLKCRPRCSEIPVRDRVKYADSITAVSAVNGEAA